MQEEEQQGVSVHTGFPNPATDKSLNSLDLNKLLIQHSASTYLFRIEGQDWERAGVFDSDIAIIDRTLDPRKSDVVLWWDESKGEFAISSYIQLPEHAAVWGVVTATIHQFRKQRINKHE